MEMFAFAEAPTRGTGSARVSRTEPARAGDRVQLRVLFEEGPGTWSTLELWHRAAAPASTPAAPAQAQTLRPTIPPALVAEPEREPTDAERYAQERVQLLAMQRAMGENADLKRSIEQALERVERRLKTLVPRVPAGANEQHARAAQLLQQAAARREALNHRLGGKLGKW